MKFYLMRHAEAEKGPELDITREITSIGEKQATWIAKFLLTQTDKIKLVLHSDMHRGQQTAEIVADILGVDTAQDPHVGPVSEPTEVMKAIKQAWKQNQLGDDELVVIGHGPSINKFAAWLLNSGEGDKFHFSHGSVCHFDTQDPETYGPENKGIEGRGEGVRAYLHWMVTAKLVKRAMKQDLEAVIKETAAVVEALADLVEAPKGESLRHPKHMRIVAPLRKTVQQIAADYFKAQGHSIMRVVRKNIPAALEQHQEAKSPNSKKFAQTLLPDDIEPLTFAVGAAQASEFGQAISDAISKAAAQLAADLKSDAAMPGDKLAEYLADHSLSKLTGGWNATTLERLRNALADSYSAGGTAEQIEQALQDTIDSFSDFRAAMIAQTEVNAAYNFGRKELARAAGMEEKAVDPDGEACEFCMEQVDAGWIPIDEVFPSGDDGAPFHPNCDCGSSFRTAPASDAEAEESLAQVRS